MLPPVATAPPKPAGAGWITFFGILELMLAGLTGLMAAAMMALALFGEAALKGALGGRNALTMIFPSLFYGAASLLLLMGGAGTLGRRRWARILMIVIATFWMIFGMLASIAILAMVPIILEETQKAGRILVPGVTAIVWMLVGGGTFFFGIGLPGSMLLFYTRPSVKAAFAARDPEEVAARRLPLALSILAVWIGIGAVASVCSAPYGILVLFGAILTGPAAVALMLAGGGVQAFFVWGIVRRQGWIWWGIFAYYLLLGISAAVSLKGGSLDEVMRRIGATTGREPSQQAILEWTKTWTPWIVLVSQLLFLCFLVYTKRYFRTRTSEAGASPLGEPAA
ncbi:MAG TPA: hypothetical protein VFW45_12315 [Candidatus Polarisedimenticolia bacterium]|nr:hypothetical protein [Candidatus Polarisedimenticolia bacterium]